MSAEEHKITISINGKTIHETVTRTGKSTEVIAEKFGKTLKGGEVLALSGDLGAGKTTFVKGLARCLKVSETITSPTFVLMNVYPARITGITELVHIDCYRLEKPDDFIGIGAREYLGAPSTVTAIEWPERVQELLPKNAIWIRFEIV